MDINPCPLCGCGSGDNEGDCSPIAKEEMRGPFKLWVVRCQNRKCMAVSWDKFQGIAIDRWNNGDVV